MKKLSISYVLSIILLSSVLFVSSETQAQNVIVVPNNLTNTDGNSFNSVPLSCIQFSMSHYQQVYLASEFGGNTCNIIEIRFRTDADAPAGPIMRTQNDVSIEFSTTSVSPATLSNMFADNIGADVTNVFNGNLSINISPPCGLPGPCPFDTIITLQTPFLYDPLIGNLLLDLSITECTGIFGNQNFWDATDGGVNAINRLFSNDVNSPIGIIDNGNGLVTQFVCEPEPLPTVNLAPPTATNEIDTDHTVTATVTNRGTPVEGEFVEFRVLSGPNIGERSNPDSGECTPNDDCTTDANGQVSWTYSSQELGTDTIIALIFDENIEGEIESNIVEKIWIKTRNVPTLSEWGLITLAGILGMIGFFVIRRRQITINN